MRDGMACLRVMGSADDEGLLRSRDSWEWGSIFNCAMIHLYETFRMLGLFNILWLLPIVFDHEPMVPS